MNREKSLALVAALVGAIMLASSAVSQPGLTEQQAVPKPGVEQQRQLERHKQLDEQVQKDRDALDAAVDRYGWDSDEADAAQEQLLRDRREYRKVRGSLQAAGVPVPSPADPGQGLGGPRGGRGGVGGPLHPYLRWPMCCCPCCDWPPMLR